MKYRCLIVEVSYGYIDVEADNKDEAAEIADKQYHAGNTDWVGTDDKVEQEFNIVTMGYNLDGKFELNTFEHHKFVNMEEAELWAETYFLYLNDFEYYVHPSEKAVYNTEP